MFGYDLEHDQFRKHVSVFGNIFNGIKIYRRDQQGNRIQTIAVPIEYGERSKFLERVIKDPNFISQAITLPRLSFEITGIQRDRNRQQAPLNRRLKKDTSTDDRLISEREPVAYILNFELSIYTKSSYDMFQIIENILPYFEPSFHVTVINMAEGMSKKDDIRITLDNSARNTLYEGSFDANRLNVWVMQFTMYTVFHPPVSHQGLIKKIILNFITTPSGPDWDETGDVEQLTITPGLTVDGLPTNNPNEAIHYSLVKPDDNYGFVEQWRFYSSHGGTLIGETVATTPDPIATNPTQQLHFHLEGPAGVLSAGQKAYVLVPRDCVIKNWFALANTAGSIVLDVRAAPFGTTITSEHSIVGDNPITLVNQLSNSDVWLPEWQPHLNEGFLVEFYVESISGITQLDVWIEVE